MGVPLNLLRVDLDRKLTACQYTRWAKAVADSLFLVEATPTTISVAETAQGFHVELELATPLPDVVSVIALQTILGSDRRREALMLRRAHRNHQGGDWNEFFVGKTSGESQYRAKPKIQYARILRNALAERGLAPQIDFHRVAALD